MRAQRLCFEHKFGGMMQQEDKEDFLGCVLKDQKQQYERKWELDWGKECMGILGKGTSTVKAVTLERK